MRLQNLATAFALSFWALSLYAGVNPTSGDFTVEYVDCTFSRGFEFQLARIYHSRPQPGTPRGIFGHKWHSVLEQRLEFQGESLFLIDYPNGTRNEFAQNSPGVYVSKIYPAQQITRQNEWWIFKSAATSETSTYFDLRGRLIRLLNKNQFVDIQYTSQGNPALISDSLEQKMFFTVNDKGLVTKIKRVDAKAVIPTSECRYEYNKRDELISARNEAAKAYLYDYDLQDRHLLTQVSEGYMPPLRMIYFETQTPEGKLGLVKTQIDRSQTTKKFSYILENAERVWLKEIQSTDKKGLTKITRFENGTGREIDESDEENLTPQEEQVLRQYLPALTLIHVHHTKLGKQSGGTGFFISPDGILLTNKHVIEKAIRSPEHFLEITLPDEKVLKESWNGMTKSQIRPRLEASATVTREVRFISCGVTYGRDLCLLKLNLYPKKYFSVDQDLPKEGAELFTIGNPRLKGLVIDHGKFLERRNHSGVSEVSISITVRPGNSGGPIFTAAGHLLGIITGLYRDVAAPTNTEQVGISAFEIKTLVDKYVAQPRTYTLEEFRRTIPADMVWYEKEAPMASPKPEKLNAPKP